MIQQTNGKFDWFGGTVECYLQTIFAPIQELLKGYHKFVPRILPNLLGSTNSNFGENLQISCVSKKDEREEIEKKLTNEYELLFIPKGL